jgi:hypothetical protein
MSIGKHTRVIFSLATGGLLLVGLFLLLAGPSQAGRAAPAQLFVKPDGTGSACTQAQPCALHTALSLAVDGDAICVAQGTYTGTGGAVITVTKSITLCGGWDGASSGAVVRDPAAYPTILDGENGRRVAYIHGEISPTIAGFTITRGNASGASVGAGRGGGICSEYAHPIIQSNVIVSNVASAGGGIYSGYGSPHILDNLIRANVAVKNGGGIYSMGDRSPLIQANLITSNSAGANWHSGGILVTSYGNGTPTVAANRIFSNTASDAAGLGLQINSDFTVTNNLIAHNSDGGIGLWDLSRYGLIAHNTVAFNTGQEGGIRLRHGHITPTIVNNVVVFNTYGIRAHTDASGTLDYNDVWGNTHQDYDLPGALEPGPHDLQADPLFVEPAGDDYHLRASSPCIDAGTDAGVTTDIDGDPRPVGGGHDIGADEVRSVIYLPLVVRSY